jgi:pimeloyl-ACP methyl ester carboxylesterase
MNMWKNMMDISMVAEYPQQNSGKLEPGRRGAPFEDKFQQAIRMYQSPWGIIYAAIVRPADPKSQIPVVLAQGWSENMKVLKESIKQLYAANRIVIALDHPRRGGAIDVHPSYPIEELRKALTIHEIIQQQDILLVDFIAHSEGAINSAIAAFLEPKRVRNIILVDPAGLAGKDVAPLFVGRFAKKT